LATVPKWLEEINPTLKTMKTNPLFKNSLGIATVAGSDDGNAVAGPSGYSFYVFADFGGRVSR